MPKLIAFCILNATGTHPEYAIFISFPLQQWLHERSWMLRYTHIACFVILHQALLLWKNDEGRQWVGDVETLGMVKIHMKC